MLLLIIIVVLLFGGGGGYYGYSRWGTAEAWGLSGRSCSLCWSCTWSVRSVDLGRIARNSNRRDTRACHDEWLTPEITPTMIVMEATLMKTIRLIGTGTLLLFLGAIAPTYAQQEATRAGG